MSRETYVVGIGMYPYQAPGRTSFIEMGTTAVREALGDAGLDWARVQSAYVSTITLGLGAGWKMLRHLGATGLSVTQVANASASGSSAFRQAHLEVASGESDVALAVGVDVGAMMPLASQQDFTPTITGGQLAPLVVFALESKRYMDRYGATREDLARVAVKNLANGSLNPYAQRRTAKTLEEVLGGRMIADPLNGLQVCPVGEGAAAAIIVAGDALDRLGIDRSRAIRIAGSVSISDDLPERDEFPVARLTAQASRKLWEQTGVGPQDLDLVELHEAFAVEEYLHTEAMGLYPEGTGAQHLADGTTSIGGRVAVNASGGLLAMGHPFGPTGIGQIAEITRQLRGEATGRQHDGATTGVAHMVGVGEVCVMHLLQK